MKLIHTAVAASIAMALTAAPIAFGQSALVTRRQRLAAESPATWAPRDTSSLTQINKSNIKDVGLAWVTHTSIEPVTQPVAGPGGTATSQQTIPIVVDGVMYLNPPAGGVIALDAATGAVKWKWVPSTAANGYGPAAQQRGVSIGEGKVFTTAAGNRLVALNKDTGAIVWAVVPTYNAVGDFGGLQGRPAVPRRLGLHGHERQ